MTWRITVLAGFLGIMVIVWPHATWAHLAGQPPFFKINGTYANFYPVAQTSLPDLTLPQDLAPDTYLVNQQLHFELDSSQFVVPKEVIKKTTFSWDYGDHTTGTGLITDHTYAKSGAYTLIVNTIYNDGSGPATQLLESVLITVLPDKNYKLPKAIIQINGKQGDTNNPVRFNFDNALTLDASASQAGSAPIASYLWDFGDGKKSTDSSTSHTYPRLLTQMFPMLRVIDTNGFIADAQIPLQNDRLVDANGFRSDQISQKSNTAAPAPNPMPQPKSQTKPRSKRIYIALALIALVGAIVFIRARTKRTR